MCGIVGYVGNKDVVPILIDGLKRLEYRGYDSAGIGVIENGRLELRRCVGKICNLENVLREKPTRGNIALGHTRWATHGRPSEENAHPHTDCQDRLVVVHNGIIENYLTLKKGLIKEGHKFKSETDTEVLAHLVEKYLAKSRGKKSILFALQRALKEVEGSYALGVISVDDPEKIVCARKESPLVIGLGRKEYFIASDVPAILGYTRKVIYLDDGETAEASTSGVEVYDKSGKKIKKKVFQISWDPVMAEKGGYKHFMLKEIHEQPRAIRDTFRGRMAPDKGEVYLEEIGLSKEEIRKIEKVYIVACGTSYHSALYGEFLFEELVRLPCEVDIGSEFRYRNPIINGNTLVLLISQSGETADTLAGLKEAKEKGGKTLAICNVLGSTATREADGVIYTRAGPEIGVASSKAFTAQLTALCLLAIYFGRIRGTLGKEKARNILMHLLRIPHQVEEVLENQEEIIACAQSYFKKIDFLFLGRHINYPIALEGALKLKEISYIHAEGYPAGEMKHGPIALIDENMPVLAIATDSKVYEKVMANIEEVKARDGIVIALATKNNKEIKKKAEYVFYLSETMEILSPIVNVVSLQLLAYHIAALRGCDVDQPRNLAKSVTVE
ncbi:MAG: glutamine--fructose-6-phosphate transaminase (isomerizing) [Firmicutes bacterium]|nr:glutamine--fructose-6-phosphate transaminase (isomerizing) [Bacillota bacterium]